MKNYMLMLLLITGCVLDVGTAQTSSSICVYDADIGWTGCGPSQGGGGGGTTFPVNTCPYFTCDPSLGFAADITCQGACGPSYWAKCESLSSDCSPDQCHTGYCSNWH